MEACLIGSKDIDGKDTKVVVYRKILDESSTFEDQSFEILITYSKKAEQQEPKVELKKLPHTLKYKFLDERSNQLVIVNAILG